METKPSFSLYPPLRPQGTEAHVKSGLNVKSSELVIIFHSDENYWFSQQLKHQNYGHIFLDTAVFCNSLNCLCAVGDGMIEGADSSPSKSYGGGQNLLQSRKAVQSRGTSKHYRNTRTQLRKKHKNIRETLVKFIWWVALFSIVYSTSIHLYIAVPSLWLGSTKRTWLTNYLTT